MTSDPSENRALEEHDTFPRQYARTQRLTLGEPRTISVSPDGCRVVFLRSRGGSDPINCLWAIDINGPTSNAERLIADPSALLADVDDLSSAERARRERLREGASGITSYAHDEDLRRVVFVLGGQIHLVDVDTGRIVRLVDTGHAFDARPNPQGTAIAYVDGRSLKVATIPADATGDSVTATITTIVDPDVLGEPECISWGSADFIAAEEMDRQRGFWWSPDGRRIAVCRVDESPVGTWFISDPANPDRSPRSIRYPAAGTENAVVSLSVFDIDGSHRHDVHWDNRYPYLATVGWSGPDELLLSVQTRDQQRLVICSVAMPRGSAAERVTIDNEKWVDLFPGSPQRLTNGDIAIIVHREDTARLVVAERCITPTSMNVRSIVGTANELVTFTANVLDHPEAQSVWQWRLGDDQAQPVTALDGMHTASVGGSTRVVRRSSLALNRAVTTVVSDRGSFEIRNFAETPLVAPNVRLQRVGSRRIPCALILPRHIPSGDRLPVLMDPYGGPHAQRVVDSLAAHCTSQWFADQGFAVIVVDGRGTPGLGTTWEQAVHHDLADVVLEDQVDALQALVADGAPIDVSRVGIRGWSFGGYLAALAVLRRPDVFHAAIAGAPVTDWQLYDTHYTERYLGHPGRDDRPYRLTSLLQDAPQLSRPLLLIHGLADDNVVAAHTLQLSSALLAAGRPHEVLPLSGVSHMTPQAVVAENLLLHQLDFLRRSLNTGHDPSS